MEEKENIVHNFEGKGRKNPQLIKKPAVFIGLLIILGLVTGFLISQSSKSITYTTGNGGSVLKSGLKKGDVIGSPDEKTFKDSTEGIVRAGGIDGEGAFHLERPGGDSQNVYMTSSVLDLTPFVGRQVKVWGETNTAQKAGWLMDVGRLQLLN